MTTDPDRTRARSRIPFNRVRPVGREREYMTAVLESGHTSGDGAFTARCQETLREILGAGRVLLTTSCTHALEMAALLLDIRPGDEVIVPSFTFPSTANAFALRGARIVFCDIEPRTLNLDLSVLEDLVGDRTRVVVPIHYGGVACDMDRLGDLCGRHGLRIVEDNAQGLFGAFRGRFLGTIGTLGTLSFHESKNLGCGEGGALLVNDEGLGRRAEIVREKGTDRSLFFRGEVDRYTWREIGSSYLPSEILAACLLGQLEQWKSVQDRRRRVFRGYVDRLAPVADRLGLRMPVVPDSCAPAWHLFYVLAPDAGTRDRLLAGLAERGIQAVSHYQPLHLSDAGRRYGTAPRGCPVTEEICGRILRLPFYATLTDGDQEAVVAALLDLLG
jgi:dTDP-4-amino-4,6-dideoxygalactose transaminase